MDTHTIASKRCAQKDRCVNPLGQWLPATNEYFHRNKRTPDGFNRDCKECAKRRANQWRTDHLEYAREQARLYQREHRSERQIYQRQYYLEHAEVARIRTRRHYQDHRQHHIEMERDRYYRNKVRDRDKRRRQLKQWRQNNPEHARTLVIRRRARSRQAEGSFTPADIRLLYKSQRGLCWWCGDELGKTYHIDHRIPLVQGGSNNPDNLVLSCPQCNLSKGGKLPQEWNGRLL